MVTLKKIDVEPTGQPWRGDAAELVGDHPHLFVRESVGCVELATS